jgi:hypothetical protein
MVNRRGLMGLSDIKSAVIAIALIILILVLVGPFVYRYAKAIIGGLSGCTGLNDGSCERLDGKSCAEVRGQGFTSYDQKEYCKAGETCCYKKLTS